MYEDTLKIFNEKLYKFRSKYLSFTAFLDVKTVKSVSCEFSDWSIDFPKNDIRKSVLEHLIDYDEDYYVSDWSVYLTNDEKYLVSVDYCDSGEDFDNGENIATDYFLLWVECA